MHGSVRFDDTDLGNRDGLRLLRDIRDHQLRTKPIILTGYPSVETAKIAFRDSGALEHLEKYSQGGLDIAALRRVVFSASGERSNGVQLS
jgi:ActR/RegA family two-component response regulator